MTELYQFGFGFGLAWAATQFMPKRLWRRLAARNYRGLTLTTGLGVPLAIASLLPGLIALISAAIGGESVSTFELALLVGCLLVFLAGLIDDLIGHGPRGIRAHIGAALRGRLTTGALKIVVILGAAALVASVGVAREPIRILAGIVLMAAFANLWNGLDVAPGRAAKFFVLGAWITATFALFVDSLLLRMLGATVFLGWLDLRERGMLGDSGSNLLGFGLAGSLYGIVSTPVLVGLAALGVGLNLLAETVTLSTIIRSVRPLRWFDSLGRLHLDEPGNQVREDSSLE
jgi:UDP-GlcNAc:undecaprenyl-phosphate/decaprenyl-phosphate GlcNAc-1-phosphate transferase